jgi:predicted RNA-binding Zn-ribbon protein involved in translation (DUF1610 family)
MSTHLKRLLDKNETVDHINGNKTDDRIENLQILSIGDNNRKAKIESGRTLKMVELRCPTCGKIFVRCYNNTHLGNGRRSKATFCSRQCVGKFNGLEYKDISNNVIRTFRK